MSVIEALVLGVVQGLTEFIPISSTAHLRVVPAVCGWQDPGVPFSAVIQLGSVAAVLSYFARDLASIGSGALAGFARRDFADQNVRLALAILVGTLPICLAGLALKHLLETPAGPFRSLYLIGGTSIFMGLFLYLAERAGKRRRQLSDMGVLDGLIVGIGQVLSLVPGCSRSGSTLTVALILNMERQDAARFSFLLGIPAITLSGLVELVELFRHGLDGSGLASLGAGLLASAVVSYLSIAWLINFLSRRSTLVFIGYRLVFGAAVILLASARMIR